MDGRLDEALWITASPATDFVQHSPRSGASATERTEARVLVASDALYIGIRMYDSRPDSLIARLGRRDENVFSDWITVQIDSYRDRRTAFTFSLNPRGVRRDALITDDKTSNTNWDAVWDGAARSDSLGWVAEFRIPLSQLRFSRCDDTSVAEISDAADSSGPRADQSTVTKVGGDCIWGINFRRYIARRDETSDWSPIPRTSGRLVSLFGELRGVGRLTPPSRVELQPYAVARVERAPVEAGNPFYSRNDFFKSVGADLNFGLGSAFTVNATFNPDFGQVEADASDVNLTAYETSFPEKRPFFIEGADIFSMGVGSADLFYTRRIGRTPQRSLDPSDGYYVDEPRAATVLGAAKLSGRTSNGWAIGALTAVTDEAEARVVDPLGRWLSASVEPLTTYGVLRAKKEGQGGRSSVGFMLTTVQRRLVDGDSLGFLRESAYTGGVDARRRIAGNKFELSGALLGSWLVGSTESISRLQRGAGHFFQRPDATHLNYDSTRVSLGGYGGKLSLTRISGSNWTWGMSASALSPGFEVSDIGFQRASDRVNQSAYVNYFAYVPTGILKTVNIGANQRLGWTFGGERTSTGADATVDVQFVNQWGASLGLSRDLAATSVDALRGGPSIASSGNSGAWFSTYSSGRGPLSVSTYGNIDAEDGTGGGSFGLGASVGIRPMPQLALSFGTSYSHSVDAAQWVDAQTVSGTKYYFFARINSRTTSVTSRMNLVLAPTLSLQVYASPFVSSGRYTRFRMADNLRAANFADRYRTFAGVEIRYIESEHSYAVDHNTDGVRDFTLWNPDFSVSDLNTSAVLRWEYRPGSTLYVAFTQSRYGYGDAGLFRPWRELGDLLTPGRAPALSTWDALMIKMSYRLGK